MNGILCPWIYVWNPSDNEMSRVKQLIDAGYGNVEIAEDMGVDPIDIERIRLS